MIGIANSQDLTDRILPRLHLKPEICPEVLSFPAYKKSEIFGILENRLAPFMENTEKRLFQKIALEFLAGKISANSGDVRKALDVCRKAIDIKIKAQKQMVLKPLEPGQTPPGFRPIGVSDIAKIVNSVYCSKVIADIKNGASNELPRQQKFLLACLNLMSNHRNNKEITLGKLHETYVKVCQKKGFNWVSFDEAGSMCDHLEVSGLLEIKKQKRANNGRKDNKINLRVDEKEVEAALKDTHLFSDILNCVDCLAK